jgi:hypothetical protein
MMLENITFRQRPMNQYMLIEIFRALWFFFVKIYTVLNQRSILICSITIVEEYSLHFDAKYKRAGYMRKKRKIYCLSYFGYDFSV